MTILTLLPCGYNADVWKMINLKKGDIVYAGLSGQSAYYTSEKTLLASSGSSEFLSKSLQIRPHHIFGYRPDIGQYEVLKDIRVPIGTVSANLELGNGGGMQYFIKNYQNLLNLENRYNLENFYDHCLSTNYHLSANQLAP